MSINKDNTIYKGKWPSRQERERIEIGTITVNGQQYTMAYSLGGNWPMLKCKKTKKWYLLLWGDIVELAIEAGIDKPDK